MPRTGHGKAAQHPLEAWPQVQGSVEGAGGARGGALTFLSACGFTTAAILNGLPITVDRSHLGAALVRAPFSAWQPQQEEPLVLR